MPISILVSNIIGIIKAIQTRLDSVVWDTKWGLNTKPWSYTL